MLKYKLAFISLLIVSITSCVTITKQPLKNVGATSKDTRLTSMISPPIEEIPFSEDEAEKKLATALQSWEGLEQNVTIEPDKKGFTVNGQPFLDPDGKIVKYAANYSTGDVSYLLHKGSDQYLIKSSRVPQVKKPITIATGTQAKNGIWSIQTNNGKQLQGQNVILFSIGFLIVGRNSVFRYLPGKGFSNFGTPGEGFHIASYQNGDVSSTNYILLEKTKTWSDNSEDPLDNLRGFWDATKDLGALFGLTKKEDYMLVNIKTGQVHSFDISIAGKNIHAYSNCEKQNRYAQKCKDMHSVESLYERNGLPNYRHYFWRIRWFNTSDGAIAIAQENQVQDVTLTNLTTRQKVVAFESTAGFNGFDAVQDASGKITVAVDMSPIKLQGIVQGGGFIGGLMGSFLSNKPKLKINEKKIDDVAEYISLHSNLKNME